MAQTRHRLAANLSAGFRRTVYLTVFLCVATTAAAEERFVDFLNGLRERRYFDTALQYLNSLETRSDVPQEFAATLDLERGVTYRALARVSRPDDAEQALANAEQALNRFLAKHAGHPQAALANSELGQLLFERARRLLWDAESPSNRARKQEMQQQARTMIDRAKSIYQRAHDQYKRQYDEFPKFIDRDRDARTFEARLAVDIKYLRAWFDLIRCSFERGLTFSEGSPERTSAMSEASQAFEELHSVRRDNSVGLQSRLMVGKCYQEQGDLKKALGIYQEMLSQNSTKPVVIFLRSLALQYRLVCLNHQDIKQYEEVMQEADQWLKDRNHRDLIYQETGLGILWEKAVAQERHGSSGDLDETKRAAVLRQAAADAKQVARFAGPYQQAAIALGVRVSALLGTDNAEPRDFAAAFDRGRAMTTQLKGLERKLASATSEEERQQARQNVDLQLNEMGRMFELALALRDADSDAQAVAQARYLLSFVYMKQRKSLDAIVLARYCMKYDREKDPDSALTATEIAINAAVQALNDAEDDREFELDLLKDICQQIVDDYPQSSKGNEARMRLGQVYRDLKQPLQAAEQYLSIPADASIHGSARIHAGLSYWLAWVTAVTGRNEDAVEQDTAVIDQWKTDAQKLLTEGLDISRKKIGSGNKPTAEIVAAEVTLAEAMNIDGKFAESIRRLTAGDQYSVVRMVEVPDNEDRPAKGITSNAFAAQTYRALLRAYVGEQQIGRALGMMKKLEDLGGQDVTRIYTQLGRELQNELTRLAAAGDTARLQQVRTSFEKFLAEVNNQRDKTDYRSLLWIGETYFSLGNGVSDDSAAAADYFRKASGAYNDILNGNLADAATLPAVKVRLVKCLRAQKNFAEAVNLAKSVLQQRPLQLDVQFEAAYTLSDWGADKRQAKPEKLLEAIRGDGPVWGWSNIVRRLQARQATDAWEKLKDRYLEARYEFTNSRYRYAKAGGAEAGKQLEAGQSEISLFALAFPDLTEDWYARFDGLYQNIRRERGLEPQALKLAEPVKIPVQEVVTASAEETETAQPETAADATPEIAPPEPPNLAIIGAMIAIGAVTGGLVYRVMSKPSRPRRAVTSPDTIVAPTDFGVAAGGADDGAPDFSQLAAELPGSAAGVATAAPRKKRVAPKQPAAEGAGASATRVKKKKRVLTPEEMERYKAAKLAKARAAAAGGETSSKPKTKRPQAQDGKPAGQVRPAAPGKKRLKKRPPPPPTE